MEGEVLEMPQFIPSVHKSTKQFGFIFAYDAPKVWIEYPSQKPTHPRFYHIF